MGWWKLQGSEDVVGDDAFSILRTATKELYSVELGRQPSRREWQTLILDALEPLETLDSAEATSLFNENASPRAVEIELEPLK